MNMKKIVFLVLLSAISMSFNICGAENMNNSYSGYQKYGKETVSSIQGNGSVVLEETKVLGLLQVNGSLKADESLINSLQVNGQADLNNCVIANTTIINGSLNANNTKFQQELSVASQKIVLRMCSLDSLTIREVSGYTGTQVIDLRSGTNVTGAITVESGKGEIWISSNSEIQSSQVSGAQVYKK